MTSIDLCSGWTRIGEAPAAVLNAVSRHLQLGEWQLSGAVGMLSFDSGRSLADVDSIRVVDDTRIIFAGLVGPVDGGDSGLRVTTTSEGDRFTLTGPDVWSVLAGRVAFPTPTTLPPWADSHDTRSGQASTVAAAFVEANLGAGALAARQTPIAVIDGAAGASGTWSARLQRLDELVARICADGGITCLPTVQFDGSVRVAFVATGNRSNRTVLSDQGDLVTIERLTLPTAASYVIAGGQGELSARAFATAGGGSGLHRRELFLDATNLESPVELARRADTVLAESAGGLTVSAVLSDAATQRSDMRYLVDFVLGDILAVELDGVRHEVPVTAVAISIAPGRRTVRPVFGPAGSDPLRSLIRSVAALESINRNSAA